jgi:hypothetical protein
MSWECRAANDIELRYSTDVTAGLNELFTHFEIRV